MKYNILILIMTMLLIISCSKKCPDCPTADNALNPIEDLAGYLDGESQMLFTTATAKNEVLNALNAEELSEGNYQLPVDDILAQPFMMCFRLMEVESPYSYINASFSNACFENVLLSLHDDLNKIIDGDLLDLENDILLATGDALGQLTMEVGDDNENRIRDGRQKDAEQTKEKLKEVKEETKEEAKEATDKIKDQLEQDDKDGAKEEGKEFVLKLKYKWSLGLKWDLDYQWCDDEDLDGIWPWDEQKPICEPGLPDLIKEFVKNKIRYKVYSNAKCNTVDNPTITWPCSKRGGRPATYFKTEPVPSRNCIRGANFCVEQEVIVEIAKIYSDSLCTRLIGLDSSKGFSCK